MQTELTHIVNRTTNHVNDFISSQNGNEAKLLELVQTLFDQFKDISHAHVVFLDYVNRAIKAHNIELKPYNINFYWVQVEGVVSI